MTSAADPHALVSRFAAGDTSPEVLAFVRAGFATWARAGGTLSLERAMKLPNTQKRAQRLQRDHWLCVAASLLEESSAWAASVAVARELDVFLTRGPWRAWCELAAPPDGASALRTALFWLAKSNGGRSITARHVSRVVGHFFTEKCQSESATITSRQTGETFGD